MIELPLIVQADGAVLLETWHDEYESTRDRLGRFATLEKSPEYVHFYRITPVSIWNAAALGETATETITWLTDNARFPVAAAVTNRIAEWFRRYGLIALHAAAAGRLRLCCDDEAVIEELAANEAVLELVTFADDGSMTLPAARRGELKQVLIRIGYPVDDRAGYETGVALSFSLRRQLRDGRAFALRDYQAEAAAAFHAGGSDRGGCGVVVLPCGAGKTVVGLLAASRVGMRTLVVTSGTAAAEQWRREALARFEIAEADVVTYTSGAHRVAPITVTTYSMLASKGGSGPTKHTHFDRLSQEDFGLVIYDEVHLVPAPVFRLTAALQAKRRLGLTATLVREDGRERDVFALIGPKRFDVPWRELEASGHIAEGLCVEYRVALTDAHRDAYARADVREAPAVAASNPAKLDAVEALLQRHAGEPTLVIGSYLEPLERIARRFTLPLVTGATSAAEREVLYERFRQGEVSTLVLSRVGNSSIDLPGASVMIQVSGSMGSRQEEAQRLGRIL
ncbi:MAG: DEAD/DEAH box helicase, partial [Planctomycetes bacterium]|nr:DEAD/DEAH box helicase [Planctomycetota bacterium]